MSYSYTSGQGVSALVATEPNGAVEPVSNLDDAIRQIKAFLTDPTAGWPSLLAAVGAAASTGNHNFFSAYSSANQTVPVNAETKLSFGLEQADPDSVFDPANSRFTAPATGWYKITASLRVDWLVGVGLTTGYLSLFVRKNGVNLVVASENNIDNFSGSTYVLERSIPLNAGEYLELVAQYTLDSGTVNCQVTSDIRKTAFQGMRVL